MKRTIFTTADGSHTILSDDIGETFHSQRGAIAEADHVFIQSGLTYVLKQLHHVNILELGFGSGLNALLTMKHIQEKHVTATYTAVEARPVSVELISKLNYVALVAPELKEAFVNLHQIRSGDALNMNGFNFTRIDQTIQQTTLPLSVFNLVYFDAFSSAKQPEIWSPEVFEKINLAMVTGGVMVTYASNSNLKSNLRKTGFELDVLPGAIGKREMIRAIKK